MERIVIVGGGTSSFYLVTALREGGFTGRIALIGDEPHPPYHRPPLSKTYLKGTAAAEGIYLRPAAYLQELQVDVSLGRRCMAIDRQNMTVRTDDGSDVPYDHLVLATGTRNRRLAIAGADLPGIFYLRSLEEADRLRAVLPGARRLVVVGGGFIGLEFAAMAQDRSRAVTVVEAAPRLMPRAVAPATSSHFLALHRGWGTEVILAAGVAALEGGSRVEAVVLSDGRRILADAVLVGIGVLPNAELAEAAGLAVGDGVIVDDRLLTSDEAISAIGDCAMHPSRFAAASVRVESIQNATDQARCVAARLLGKEARYSSVPWFWSDQGPVKLQIAGLPKSDCSEVTIGSTQEGAFSVLRFDDGLLAGVDSINRAADHMAARQLLRDDVAVHVSDIEGDGFELRSLLPQRRSRAAS